MIFVTVGSQMPFDRLIRAVDEWAAETNEQDVFAQIGPDGWKPHHIRFTEFVGPQEFRQQVDAASVIVSHAGMGTIITALERGKPLLIMPRRGDLKETRNDHQVATARKFEEMNRAVVAYDENQLKLQLSRLDSIRTSKAISTSASQQLIRSLRDFIYKR